MIKKIHYIYFVCICLLLFATQQTTRAQTTLTAGDIAVLGWNADDAYPNQKWAFMTMRSITAGTTIHFTDKGYDATISNFRVPASPANAENDGYMTWTVPSLIAVGTVIFATNNTVNGSSSGVSGQLGSSANGFGFAPTGDQIIVYQGTSGTATGATFIYALNTGQNGGYSATGAWITSGAIGFDQLSYLPPGLSNGSTALALTTTSSVTSVGTGALGSANYGFDNMYYGGTTTGSRAALLTAIATATNWVGNNTEVFNLAPGGVIPNTFTVLPVTLLYFKAEEATTGTVKLSWGTAMETNNDHFTIERSTDGIHYIVISIRPGKGDFNEPVDYAFIDHAPEQGSNFYRLSQTDRDGKMKILGVKTVTMEDIGLRVGPNPAVFAINVNFNRGAWREIKLYNSAEQLLQTIPLIITAGQTRISLQNYRPGIYYLAFVGNNGKTNSVRRFLKKD